jgi:hypothetical protein
MFGDRMKTKMRTALIALTSFVAGAIAMCCWWWYAYTHWMILPKEVEAASRAGMDAAVLAHLRLNESTNAIQQLESRMDGVVAMLAQWDSVTPPSGEIRKARDKWLLPVKIYRESYPASADVAARIDRLLANVPAGNPKIVCQSSICRLDDRHRAASIANTNSVTTKADPSASANGASPRR